jgi:hypothetical protein
MHELEQVDAHACACARQVALRLTKKHRVHLTNARTLNINLEYQGRKAVVIRDHSLIIQKKFFFFVSFFLR